MLEDVRIATAPFKLLTWKAVLFNLLALPVAVFYFVLLVAGVSVSLGLLVVVIGFFIGYGVLWLIHGMAPVEAWLVTKLLEMPVRASLPEPDGSFLNRYREMVTSPSTWSRIGYIAIKMVLALVGFGITTTAIGMLAGVFTPILFRTEWFGLEIGSVVVDTVTEAIFASVLSLIAFWLLLYLSLIVARATGLLAKVMVSDPLYGDGPPPGP